MCCHPGCVVSFLQQRQNIFTSILRNPRNFGFSFKLPVILAHNKRLSLSFETVKPSTGFSLTMKVLDGIFFKQRIINIENLFFQCSHYYSLFQLDLNNLLQFLHQFVLFHHNTKVQGETVRIGVEIAASYSDQAKIMNNSGYTKKTDFQC